jgi:hypothetical protein
LLADASDLCKSDNPDISYLGNVTSTSIDTDQQAAAAAYVSYSPAFIAQLNRTSFEFIFKYADGATQKWVYKKTLSAKVEPKGQPTKPKYPPKTCPAK